MKKKSTPTEIKLIRDYYRQGFSYKQIEKKLNKSRFVVMFQLGRLTKRPKNFTEMIIRDRPKISKFIYTLKERPNTRYQDYVKEPLTGEALKERQLAFLHSKINKKILSSS